ncbi:MAG: hypothetical protein JETT_1645 [Candidatus Jettenia ecosi]|uniref:Uncharacterized protein n=1 Tax=Candidatus Jettenia ecosi TaxID=2494326 RepID=A0A533QBH4_9BACT|nr:MAG: hypothetical protein JETT_1645 [Candidatus Jettenia ecosi]
MICYRAERKEVKSLLFDKSIILKGLTLIMIRENGRIL